MDLNNNTRIKSKNIFVEKFILIIILSVFFQPIYFTYIKVIDSFYDITLILVFCILTLRIVFKILKDKLQISAFLLIIVLNEFMIFLSTKVNNGNYQYRLKYTMIVLGLLFLFENPINKSYKNLLKGLNIIGYIYIYINFFTIILFPKGIIFDENIYWQTIHFLGAQNEQVPLIIMGGIVSILYSKLYYGKLTKTTSILMVVITITLYKIDVVVGSIMWIIIMSYYLFMNKINMKKLFNRKFILIASILMFLSISVFKVQEKLVFIFRDFFKVINRDITFTGRTEIWDKAIALFIQKPILGFGAYQGQGIIKISWNWQERLVSAHNSYFDILLQGGLISLLLFFIILNIAFRRANRIENKEVFYYMSISMFVFLVGMIMEGYISTASFYIILYLVYYLPNIYSEFTIS